MFLMSWGWMVASWAVLHSRTGARAASRARLEMSLGIEALILSQSPVSP